VGSDNFIYWVKGNNKACVAPDLYILPGISEKVRPRFYQGANRDEGSWKTWIHRVVPNFALEVKAWNNPRKDELQSPERHDALGTKELIVFDPFSHRRRAPRKRFVVYRRDDAGKLMIVVETNDRRVYSQELDTFVVMDGDDANCMLRLGVGPNGETLLPFESELVDLHARRVDQESRLRQEATRHAEEATRHAEEATRRADEATRRAEEEARCRQEANRRAEEEARRADALTAELQRLRAIVEQRPQRSKKKK
ncbi:MAG TPA: hypothetical protein PK156_21205, partial [Polyangium sp.]|nr:hypothetical protein [Polyangium sp.]